MFSDQDLSLHEQARRFYDLAYGEVIGRPVSWPDKDHPLREDDIVAMAEQAEILQPARRHDQIDPDFAFSPEVFERLCREAGEQDAQATQGQDDDPSWRIAQDLALAALDTPAEDTAADRSKLDMCV